MKKEEKSLYEKISPWFDNSISMFVSAILIIAGISLNNEYIGILGLLSFFLFYLPGKSH